MKIINSNPKFLLWGTFLLQIALSVGILLMGVRVQSQATKFTNELPQTEKKEEAVRSRIQTETDIELLRVSSLHVHNADVGSWRVIVNMTQNMAKMIFCASVLFAANSFILGYIIYRFRVHKEPLHDE